MDAAAKRLYPLDFTVPADLAEAGLNAAGEHTVRLFEAHRGPVHRYLQTFGLCGADCEEVTQETFLALYQHLRLGKPEENLAGWIFRVAHNLGLKRRLKETSARMDSLAPDLAERQPALHPSVEQRLMQRERDDRLRQVVQALGETERQCLYLRAEGLRYREIGAILGISAATVCNLLARSLEKLRRAGEHWQR